VVFYSSFTVEALLNKLVVSQQVMGPERFHCAL